MTAAARLDRKSRNTIARFGIKLMFACVFAGISRHAFFLAAALWLSIYALATSAVGILTRDRLHRHSFGHWDEVIWLSAGAALCAILHRLF